MIKKRPQTIWDRMGTFVLAASLFGYFSISHFFDMGWIFVIYVLGVLGVAFYYLYKQKKKEREDNSKYWRTHLKPF